MMLLHAVIKPNQIRLGEHTDYGSITLVFQRDIGGLQVYTANLLIDIRIQNTRWLFVVRLKVYSRKPLNCHFGHHRCPSYYYHHQ